MRHPMEDTTILPYGLLGFPLRFRRQAIAPVIFRLLQTTSHNTQLHRTN